MRVIRKQHGLTMAELMIAIALGLLIMLGMGSLFVQTKQSFRQDEIIARMQDNARFAMAEITRDIAMAGFWGPLVDGTLIGDETGAPAIAGVTTARYFDFGTPAVGGNNIASAGGFDWTTALDSVQTGSDAISVHRVEGATTEEADLQANRHYLQTNGAIGVMIAGAAAPSGSVPSPYEYWEYVPVIYYVRSFCRPGDEIPSLVRRYLRDSVATTECIAQGIESMQIQYGLDTTGDGIPNRYVNGLSAADAPSLAAIRIHLLARATEPDTAYTNDKSYAFADYTLDKSAAGASDRFYRRVYTTTIETRNPTATRLID